MAGVRVRRSVADLRVRDRAQWRSDGGAMFVRELAGQAWYMQVPVRGRVSLAQVALLLNVTVMTVHRWVSAGDLRAVDSPESKRKYVKLSDVRNFAADRGLFLGVAK